MKEELAYISVAVINIAAIVCFMKLAIYFNHWWIILFSYFFLYRTTHTEDRKEDKETNVGDKQKRDTTLR